MSYDFQFESFKNIYEWDNALKSRKNNSAMGNADASHKTSSWGGVSSYEQAEEFLTKGWSVKLEDMKNELRKFSNQVERIHNKRKSSVVGFAPIVPAAIKGHPRSMYTSERTKKIESKNYLHIYFSNDTTADARDEEIMKSGMTVLKLCVLLEKAGIKTKIDIMPYFGARGDSIYSVKVGIKDYQQPFNILKMAYPIAHAAIFRRQGFKWLETFPKCTNSDFRYGYGGMPLGTAKAEFKKQFKLEEPGSVFIQFDDCKANGFDPEKLARNKGIKIFKE